MAEVMNRAARRAAAAGKPKLETGIYIVPMGLVEQYYHTQIACEGIWNADPPVIIMRPNEEFDRATDEWFARTLSQMREVRNPGTIRYRFPGDAREIDIDIGLIDVQIYYPGNPDKARTILDNFHKANALCGHQFHTQMVIATAVHHYRPDGSPALHFHNVIFSLRKEYDGDRVHLGVLELLPLVHALDPGASIKIIEEL
jgi:hypothetical protein